MRQHEEISKCIAFLGYKAPGGRIQFVGTVFFVGHADGDEWLFTYATAAAHYLDEIKKYGANYASIRINLRGGKSLTIDTHLDSWYRHPTDHSADIAILPFEFPDDCDHLAFPLEMFATDEFVRDTKIGVGDEIFFPGLFIPYMQTELNVPIVRAGTIAALPDERVSTRLGNVEAYLIECRSIGGLSGSPVFVWRGKSRFVQNDQRTTTDQERSFRLIGFIHGDFALGPLDKITDDPESRERLNRGIAIVPTVEILLEILRQPAITRLETDRLGEERAKNGSAPTGPDFESSDTRR